MGFSNAERAQVYHEFGKLLGAGFGIDRAAQTLLDGEGRGPDTRAFAAGVKAGLEKGKTVAESVRALPLPVTELEWRLVEAGEKGGVLDEAFVHLAHYYEAVVRHASAVRAGLIYPAVLLHAGVLLPALPRAFSGVPFGQVVVSVLLQLLVVYAVIALVVVGWRTLSARARTSARADGLLRRLPVVGKVRRYGAMGRFCKVFEIFLLSGQRMSETVRAAGDASGSALVAAACRGIESRVASGRPVGEEMVAAGTVFPGELARSVVTAEESGTLEKEMARWAALMQANADEAMARLASWLPKVIYFLVLLLVAYQVLHLFWVSYLGPLRGMLE